MAQDLLSLLVIENLCRDGAYSFAARQFTLFPDIDKTIAALPLYFCPSFFRTGAIILHGMQLSAPKSTMVTIPFTGMFDGLSEVF
jgi:hypothetical protein